MTIVVEKLPEYTGSGIYIGRTVSPELDIFGMPFSNVDGTPKKFYVGSNEEAITTYRDWVWQQLDENEYFRLALSSLVDRHLRGGKVVLVCRCQGECHGNILKEMIEQIADLGLVSSAVTIDSLEDDPPF